MTTTSTFPGMPRRHSSLAEWVKEHLDLYPPHEQDIDAYRDDAWALVPHSLLPKADVLQRQVFDRAINRQSALRSIRIHKVTGEAGKKKRKYRDNLQLDFGSVYPEWLGRFILAERDRRAVWDDIEAWRDKHPTHPESTDEIFARLEVDAA